MSKKAKIILGIVIAASLSFFMMSIVAVAVVVGAIYMFNGTAPGDKRPSAGVEVRGEKYVGVSYNGYGGEIVVEVTIDGDDILAIKVVSHDETPGFGTKAFEYMIPQMVENDTWEDVDGYTGATFSSHALRDAVEDALEYSGYFD